MRGRISQRSRQSARATMPIRARLRRRGGYHCDLQRNFRVFDESDGSVIWQAVLYDPHVATNGDVFSAYAVRDFQAAYDSFSMSSDFPTHVLPVRDATRIDCRQIGVERRAAADGILTDVLQYLKIVQGENTGGIGDTGSSGAANGGGMIVSHWRVNDDGEIAMNRAALGFKSFEVYVEGLVTGSDTTVYHFPPITAGDAGTVTIQADGDLSTQDIEFTFGDDIATVEAAFDTGLNTLNTTTTDITVTGHPLNAGALVVSITWVDDSYWLKNCEFDFNGTNSGLYAGKGNHCKQSLITGKIESLNGIGDYSTSYLRDSCWMDDGNLIRVTAKNGSATTLRLECWDTSSDPWSLEWSDEALSKTPLNPKEIASNLHNFTNVVAGAGHVGISFAFCVALQDILVQRMSTLFWENDGTGKIDCNVGWKPFGLCVEDDGSSSDPTFAVGWRDWRDLWYYEKFLTTGLPNNFSESVYGCVGDGNVVQFDLSNGGSGAGGGGAGSNPAVLNRVRLGEFSDSYFPGFNSTDMFFAAGVDAATAVTYLQTRTHHKDYSPEVGGATAHIAISVGYGPSDILDPDTLVEPDFFTFLYSFMSHPNAQATDAAEWRIVWKGIDVHVAGDTEATKWFEHDATLAELNAELLLLFGEDNRIPAVGGPRQNVEASLDGVSSFGLPLYLDSLHIECQGAEDQDDEDFTGFPPLFTVEVSSVPDEAYNAYTQCCDCAVELKDGTVLPLRVHRIGAVTMSTMAVNWSRQFGDGGLIRPIYEACLNHGRLYVRSDLVCVTAGLTLVLTVEDIMPVVSTLFDLTFRLTFRNNTSTSLTVDADDLEFAPAGAAFTGNPVVVAPDSEGTFTGVVEVSLGTLILSGRVSGDDGVDTIYSDFESIVVEVE